MSHTLGIVGHTARAERINHLAAIVRPDILSIDDGQLGCEGNHRYVWQRLANDYPRAGWAVVLEDDALPVAGFDQQLEAALRVAPTPVVSLYLGRLRPPPAQRAIGELVEAEPAEHWIVANKLLHAVGVAIRTQFVARMLEHVTGPTVKRWPIDAGISDWAQHERMAVSYSWPSLVDHADGPTVITRHQDGQRRPPGRVAWRAGCRPHWTSTATPLLLP